ncbi:MAG: HAMP domain-containing histidine kinase [Bacteroides sp.]|nr:HAMP domain-containing histidine kinase [Bacteroides sp.]
MRIYIARRYASIAFLLISLIVVGAFLYISNIIVTDVATQERVKMHTWAEATREIVSSGPGSDIDFPLAIIQANTTIPVLLTDDNGTIIDHRNFNLPEPIDTLQPMYISETNMAFLEKRLDKLRLSSRVIDIEIAPGFMQHLYYEDSRTLTLLSYFPYVQIGVMIVFVVVVYFAVSSSKRAEQNKVWVGLSKETAHQLGTPISSLMAWIELLPSFGVDTDVADEMDKDVRRLASIASRFSKIGSIPELEPANVNEVVEHIAAYMSTRISSRVKLKVQCGNGKMDVAMSEPLIEWVMENLIKNAVDAMDGHGIISITTTLLPSINHNKPYVKIDVTDTGKGISRRDFKTVFRPGYTTKSRGWGLGLTLARRIVERYHGGKIFVASSIPGSGTTFTILLPSL